MYVCARFWQRKQTTHHQPMPPILYVFILYNKRFKMNRTEIEREKIKCCHCANAHQTFVELYQSVCRISNSFASPAVNRIVYAFIYGPNVYLRLSFVACFAVSEIVLVQTIFSFSLRIPFIYPIYLYRILFLFCVNTAFWPHTVEN